MRSYNLTAQEYMDFLGRYINEKKTGANSFATVQLTLGLKPEDPLYQHLQNSIQDALPNIMRVIPDWDWADNPELADVEKFLTRTANDFIITFADVIAEKFHQDTKHMADEVLRECKRQYPGLKWRTKTPKSFGLAAVIGNDPEDTRVPPHAVAAITFPSTLTENQWTVSFSARNSFRTKTGHDLWPILQEGILEELNQKIEAAIAERDRIARLFGKK